MGGIESRLAAVIMAKASPTGASGATLMYCNEYLGDSLTDLTMATSDSAVMFL